MTGPEPQSRPAFRGTVAGHATGALAIVIVTACFVPIWAFAVGYALGPAVTDQWPLLGRWMGAGALFGQFTSVCGVLSAVVALAVRIDLRYKAAVLVILVIGVCGTFYTATALRGFW